MLLNDHTCGTEPDKNGRITPKCGQCYDDAHFEGYTSGKSLATNRFMALITEMIRHELDPLLEDDKDRATSKWETARSLIAQVERIRHDAVSGYQKEYSERVYKHLQRVMTEDEFATYEQEHNEKQKD